MSIEPPPLISPIAEGRNELMQSDWQVWFSDALFNVLNGVPVVFNASIDLTTQNASIGTTSIPLPQIAAGSYLLSYYARITTVDAVSSSLTVILGWTESSVSLTLAGAAMTGNTTTTVQSGVVMVVADANTPITYATTYASNTPGVMKYRLSVKVTALQ